MPDEVRTAWTPLAPLRTVSIGKVTRVSTSSGAIPGASVITTTRGRLRFGNTSMGSCSACQPPYPIRNRANAATSSRF